MKWTIMRTVCSVLLGLSLAVAAEAQPKQSCSGDAIAGNGLDANVACTSNVVRREPIVMWDVTGHNLAGPVHGRLVVYNDGVTSVSSLGNGDVRSETIAPALAQALRRDLIQAGATTLCDQTNATDMPLTTLTMFVGNTDAQAHTFSYWVANNGYAAIQAEIDDLLATHFPGFAVN
jgi:hypothetical protein